MQSRYVLQVQIKEVNDFLDIRAAIFEVGAAVIGIGQIPEFLWFLRRGI